MKGYIRYTLNMFLIRFEFRNPVNLRELVETLHFMRKRLGFTIQIPRLFILKCEFLDVRLFDKIK